MKAITVSQLNNYIKQVFDAEELLHNIQVVGEIDGISIRGNAVYFSIKDEGACIPCVCYQPAKLGGIKNGQSVSVRGTVGYWHKAGKINFTVYHAEVFGFGQLFLKFQELKVRLEKEGFFDAGRKKSLPQNPRRIGVITSKQGAVLHDIVKVVHRRNSTVDIVLYPVQVQGVGAETSIVQGIEFFNNLANSGSSKKSLSTLLDFVDEGEISKQICVQNVAPVDVIIVARGGGSAEDLAAFNSESVSRAVFSSTIPIVSAVGHETDWTLIDFVADLRAPTPSAAAELVVDETLGQRERVGQMWKVVRYLLNQNLAETRRRLGYSWSNCRSVMVNGFGNVSHNTISSYYVTRNATISCGERVEGKLREISGVVEANNPMAILMRGYGRIFGGDGTEIKGIGSVKNGDSLDIRMHDGIINAEVKGVKKL